MKLAAFLLLSLPLAAQTPDLTHTIPPLLASADIPGAAIALIRSGQPTQVLNFGQSDVAANKPVTDTTLFSVGSLSKPVFAYAVLRLADQGKLDLDAPLTKYVPKPFVDNDPRLAQITARLVLSHRSGLPNRPPRAGALKIYFTPGERFSYSGEAFQYLQQAVEAITGEGLDTTMQREVFTPLGMTHSSYLWQPRWAPDAASGYNPDATPAPIPRTHVAVASDSLNTTAADYARFVEAVLNEKVPTGKGLKPATLVRMQSPVIALDPTCFNCVATTPKNLSTELFWGLGWGIEKTATGTYLWHWGDNNIFKSFVVADLTHRTAVVLFTNSDNGLAIAPAVVHATLGGAHPAFAWLHYDTYESPNFRFNLYTYKHTAAETLAAFSRQMDDNTVSEDTVNSYGYRLLRKHDNAAAIAVFRRNVKLHPASSNVYDSLGEAYMIDGQNQSAIDNYTRELQLNPNSGDARQALQLLQKKTPLIQQPTPLIKP